MDLRRRLAGLLRPREQPNTRLALSHLRRTVGRSAVTVYLAAAFVGIIIASQSSIFRSSNAIKAVGVLAHEFVATGGNDDCSRNGSAVPYAIAVLQGNVCQTMNAAYTIADQGDTVAMEAGTYPAQTINATSKSGGGGCNLGTYDAADPDYWDYAAGDQSGCVTFEPDAGAAVALGCTPQLTSAITLDASDTMTLDVNSTSGCLESDGAYVLYLGSEPNFSGMTCTGETSDSFTDCTALCNGVSGECAEGSGNQDQSRVGSSWPIGTYVTQGGLTLDGSDYVQVKGLTIGVAVSLGDPYDSYCESNVILDDDTVVGTLQQYGTQDSAIMNSTFEGAWDNSTNFNYGCPDTLLPITNQLIQNTTWQNSFYENFTNQYVSSDIHVECVHTIGSSTFNTDEVVFNRVRMLNCPIYDFLMGGIENTVWENSFMGAPAGEYLSGEGGAGVSIGIVANYPGAVNDALRFDTFSSGSLCYSYESGEPCSDDSYVGDIVQSNFGYQNCAAILNGGGSASYNITGTTDHSGDDCATVNAAQIITSWPNGIANNPTYGDPDLYGCDSNPAAALIPQSAGIPTDDYFNDSRPPSGNVDAGAVENC